MAEHEASEGGAAASPTARTSLTTEAFDYPLDERLIAQRPLATRDASRLLLLRRQGAAFEDRRFSDLVSLPATSDVLVLNDSRVFPARLLGRKPSGAAAEILLVEALDAQGQRWRALVRPGSKLKPGRTVEVSDELSVEIEGSAREGGRIVRLHSPLPPFAAVERFGRVPLPPYIRRDDDRSDRIRYQTVYARNKGSVAAPTAGLHFSRRLLDALGSRGVTLVTVTLHVGPGTFRPVEVADPKRHRLEAEHFRIGESAAAAVNRTREQGGAVWAVGTTTVRALESAASPDGRVAPGEGNTDLFIRPGYEFRVVDRLITNFHLPRSTLLMLVAAFAGYEFTMSAYHHAARAGYRFYSYGDAMAVI